MLAPLACTFTLNGSISVVLGSATQRCTSKGVPTSKRVPSSSALKRTTLLRASMEKSATSMEGSKFDLNFPFLSEAGRKLMEDAVFRLERELVSSLNPTRTPPDVRSFKNPQGNGEGSVIIRSGKHGSKIGFVLGSWLHCDLPFGALNIATLVCMLNSDTDAPHLLFEFIQTGPNSLVLVLDLLPRKDLVLHPEYLNRFYEETELECIREGLQKSLNAEPYVSSAMYIRSVISPTAIMLKINGFESGLDGVISEIINPAANKIINIWLEGLSTRGQIVEGPEREILVKRDSMIKTKGVEVDLSSNMPRLFGHDIANKVVEAFRKGE